MAILEKLIKIKLGKKSSGRTISTSAKIQISFSAKPKYGIFSTKHGKK
jgi:hypothetical protein